MWTGSEGSEGPGLTVGLPQRGLEHFPSTFLSVPMTVGDRVGSFCVDHLLSQEKAFNDINSLDLRYILAWPFSSTK